MSTPANPDDGPLQAALAAITSGVVIQDASGAIVYANDAAQQIIGLSLDQLRGLTSLDPRWLTTQEDGTDLPGADHPARIALTTGRAVKDVIVSMALPSGERRWLQADAVPTLRADGTVCQVVVTFTDITQRRRAEETLRSSRAHLELALTAARMVAWEWDPLTDVITTTDNFVDIYGLPRIEMVAQGFALVHPDDVARHGLAVQRAVETVGSYRSEFRVVRPDTGQTIWLEERGQAHTDETGTVRKLIGVVMDITERKQAEVELLESEQRFRATFDLAAVGIAHVAPTGRWLRVNQRLCDIVGYTQDELLQGSFQQITYPPDLDTDLALVQQVLAGEIKTYVLEKRYVRKDGSLVWINLTVSLVRDAAGAPKYFISVVEDISERKRTQQETERARAATEAALRLRDEFLSIAGHEMRTPLTSVLGNVELAAAWIDQPELPPSRVAQIRTLLQRSQGQAVRLNRLVTDLLDASRIQADRLELQRARCDLAAIIDQTVGEQRQLAPTRVIRLDRGDDDAVPVFADADRLAQVVTNFVSNALRYSSPDQPVTVGLEVDRLAEPAARVWVRDGGPGVPPEEQERIWERFYRVSGTPHRDGSSVGLGLGLSISRNIIERHGGRVGVDSVPGRGATFWFRLPLAE